MRNIAVCSVVLAAGCVNNSHRSAKPLAPGVKEFNVGWVAGGEIDGADTELTPLPAPSISVRRGMSENVDIGGQVSGVMVEGDAKVRFLERGRLHAAVAPTGTVVLDPVGRGYEALLASAPVLLTRELDSVALLFGLGGGAGISDQRELLLVSVASAAFELENSYGFIRPGVELLGLRNNDDGRDAVLALLSLQVGLRGE